MPIQKIELDSKEVTLVKQQVSKAVSAAQNLQIKNKEDLVVASSLLTKIKQVGKIITERKEAITKPANEVIKSARELFKPFEDQYKQAEGMIKFKMVEFNDKQEAEAKKKEEKIIDKVEGGKMSFDKGAEKIENAIPDKVVKTDSGKSQFKIIKEVVVEDETKLPREYLVPDMGKIKKDALEGQEIPGVKVIDKKIVAGSF